MTDMGRRYFILMFYLFHKNDFKKIFHIKYRNKTLSDYLMCHFIKLYYLNDTQKFFSYWIQNQNNVCLSHIGCNFRERMSENLIDKTSLFFFQLGSCLYNTINLRLSTLDISQKIDLKIITKYKVKVSLKTNIFL